MPFGVRRGCASLVSLASSAKVSNLPAKGVSENRGNRVDVPTRTTDRREFFAVSDSRASVLIFGGGLIGSAAAEALARRHTDVTVVTRAPAPQRFDADKWLFGDLMSDLPERMFGSRNAVVYAAGSMTPASQISSVAEVLSDQVIPVVALAERAAGAGVPTFVFISSGGTVYGRAHSLPTSESDVTAPINSYGMIKVQTEQALLEVGRRTGMSVAILRVSNPYGPGQVGNRRLGFIAAAIEAAIRDTPLTIWGDGSNTRDFVFIDDVADAIRRATKLTDQLAILNVGSGRETSLLEICERVGATAGKAIDVRFHVGRAVDVERSVLNIERAAATLGWTPGVSLEDGIQRTLGMG